MEEQPIGAFFDAWALTDSTMREAALDAVLAPAFLYVDPNTPGPIEDLGQLSDYIGAFTARMPDAQARLVGCDLHHRHARAVVEFTTQGRAIMRGQYFAVLDDLRRIERIAGFNGTGDPT